MGRPRMKVVELDIAEMLRDGGDEAVAGYLEEAFATDDPAYIASAMGTAMRAKGMSEVAEGSGISRERLYSSFSESGNPTLKTVVAALGALGWRLSVKPQAVAADRK
jgi:probable addiction module antidote protein